MLEADEELSDGVMNGSDKFATAFTIVSAIILGSLPVYIFWAISSNFETLNDPETKDKYGYLYEGISTKTKWQTLYHFVYIFRRTAFVLILIFLHDHVGIQLIA